MNRLKNMLKAKRKTGKEPKKNRMLVLRKRQITAVALVLLIGIAGYLNWSFQQEVVDPEVAAVYGEVSKKLGEAQMVSTEASKTPTQAQQPQAEVNDYFAQARLERDVKRSESMDMLSAILDAQETDKEARSQAEDEIHRLADFTEKEVMTENLIKAKGFSDVVVFMGENLISIAVKSEGLNEIDVAVLQDAAMGTTGYSAEAIKIVEVK